MSHFLYTWPKSKSIDAIEYVQSWNGQKFVREISKKAQSDYVK